MAKNKINKSVRVAVDGLNEAEDKFKKFGDTGEKAFDKVKESTKPAAKALEAVDEVSGELQSSMGGLANEAGVLGGALTKLGPVGLVVAAGIGAVTLGSKAAVDATDQYRLSIQSLEGVLKATGNATGLTLKQLDTFSRDLARSTLNSSEDVRRAAATLAAFGGVAEDSFKRTITVAADMAAVFQTDLQNATEQLGEALSNPTEALTLLEGYAVRFTDAEKEMIETMVKAGKEAEVQEMIFGRLEKRFSGVAASIAGGTLSGSKDGLAQSWQEFLEVVDTTFEITEKAAAGFNFLADSLDRVTESLTKENKLARQIAEETAEIAERENGLIANRARMTEVGRVVEKQAIEDKKVALKLLEEELQALKDKEAADIKAAELSQAKAVADKKENDALALRIERGKKLAELLKKEGEERKKQLEGIKKTNDKLDDEIALLVLQRKSLEGTAKERAAAIKQLRELQTEIEIKNTLQSLGIQQDGDEAASIRAKIEARNNEKAAIDDVTAATKAAEEAAKKAADESAKAAEAMQQPWIEAAEGIRQAFVRTFEEIFRTGSVSISGIGNLLKDTFAQLAGTSLTNGILGVPNAAGGFTGGLLGGGVGGLAASGSLGLSTLFGYSSNAGASLGSTVGIGQVGGAIAGNVLLGAGLGALGGGALANLVGGNETGGQIGGGIGGAAGAGLWSIGAVGGPVGIGIAIAGALIGSLFGPGESNKLQGAEYDFATGGLDRFGFEGKKFSQQNHDIVTDFFGRIDSLTSALEQSTGGKVGLTDLAFQVGDRDGIQLSIGDSISRDFDTAESAFAFAVQNIVSSLDDVSVMVQTAIDNLDFEENLEGSIQNLQLVVDFENLLDALTREVDIITPVEQALSSLQSFEDEIMSLSDTFEEMGLTVQEAVDKINEGRDALREQFEDEVSRTINQLSGRGFINTLNDAAGIRDTQFSDAALLGASTDNIQEIFRLTVANILGGLEADDLNGIISQFSDFPIIVGEAQAALTLLGGTIIELNDTTETTNALISAESELASARAAYVSSLNSEVGTLRTVRDTWDRLFNSLKSGRNALSLDSNLSILSPLQQLDYARGIFDETANKALGGNQQAIADFPAVRRALLDASRAVNASNSIFAADFKDSESISKQLETLSDTNKTDAQKSIDVLERQLSSLIGIENGIATLAQLELRYNDAVTNVNTANDNNQSALKSGLTSDYGNFINYYNDGLSAGLTHDTLGGSSSTNTFLGAAANAISQITDGGFLRSLNGAVNSFSGTPVFQALSALLSGRFNSFATGGFASGMALVGEEGPELVRFNRPAQVYNANQSRNMMDTGSVVDAQQDTNRVLAAGFQVMREELRSVKLEVTSLKRQQANDNGSNAIKQVLRA